MSRHLHRLPHLVISSFISRHLHRLPYLLSSHFLHLTSLPSSHLVPHLTSSPSSPLIFHHLIFFISPHLPHLKSSPSSSSYFSSHFPHLISPFSSRHLFLYLTSSLFTSSCIISFPSSHLTFLISFQLASSHLLSSTGSQRAP